MTPARRKSALDNMDKASPLHKHASWYLQSLRAAGLAANTIDVYLGAVHELDKFLRANVLPRDLASITRDELERVATSHGWSLDGIPLLEFSAIESLLQPESQTTVFHASEMELGKVARLLRDEITKYQPKRVVFDSLSEFRLLAETPLRYRRQLLTMKQELAKQGSTVLLLDDKGRAYHINNLNLKDATLGRLEQPRTAITQLMDAYGVQDGPNWSQVRD